MKKIVSPHNTVKRAKKKNKFSYKNEKGKTKPYAAYMTSLLLQAEKTPSSNG